MFDKILVCVDGSIESMHACRMAAKLASRLKSWVTVVNVCEANPQAIEMMALEMGESDGFTARESYTLRDRLEEQTLSVFEEHGVEAAAVRLNGNPTHQILHYAGETQPDLIVMGNRGCSQLDELLIGSVSLSVIRHAKCPVLIARCETCDITRILVGADCSQHSDAAIRTSLEMASILHCGVSVVNVCDSPDAIEDQLAGCPEPCDQQRIMSFISEAADISKRSDDLSPDFRQIIGKPAEVITRLAHEEDVDLIILGSRGRNALVSMVLGSVSEQVVRDAHCSVLIVRA